MNTDIKSLSLKAASKLFPDKTYQAAAAIIIEGVLGPIQAECKEYADLLAAAEEKLDSANRDRATKRKRALRAEERANLAEARMTQLEARVYDLEKESEAIRTLSTAETLEAEALVERLFVASGMLAEEPPLIAFARIKLELQRLRMSVFFARNLIQSLQDPECVGCGAEAGAACKNDCQLWDWMEKRGEVLHAHRLIPPFPAAVATQEE